MSLQSWEAVSVQWMSPAFQVSQVEECPESSLQEYLKLSGLPNLTLALEMKARFQDEGTLYL